MERRLGLSIDKGIDIQVETTRTSAPRYAQRREGEERAVSETGKYRASTTGVREGGAEGADCSATCAGGAAARSGPR